MPDRVPAAEVCEAALEQARSDAPEHRAVTILRDCAGNNRDLIERALDECRDRFEDTRDPYMRRAVELLRAAVLAG